MSRPPSDRNDPLPMQCQRVRLPPVSAAQEPDIFDHPVFQPHKLRLETPPMRELRNAVEQWVWTGATGGRILGPARAGKTTALMAVSEQLHTRGGRRIPTVIVSIAERDQRTVVSIFRQLCYTVNLRVTHTDRADHLSDRFVHYILDRERATHSRQAVIIVDEMQRLAPRQFAPFAELYDKLRLFGVQLNVIFAGNDQESQDLLAIIEQPRYAHIRGRFFSQAVEFRGLQSRREVEFCLAQYDTLRHPADGPTYTACFLPKAVAKGWRLESVGADLWRIFREYQVHHKIPGWGMQYFLAAVNTLLADYLAAEGVAHIDDTMLRACIEESGLIPSQVRNVR